MVMVMVMTRIDPISIDTENITSTINNADLSRQVQTLKQAYKSLQGPEYLEILDVYFPM